MLCWLVWWFISLTERQARLFIDIWKEGNHLISSGVMESMSLFALDEDDDDAMRGAGVGVGAGAGAAWLVVVLWAFFRISSASL